MHTHTDGGDSAVRIIRDDTAINVAQLLQAEVGAVRDVQVFVSDLELDDDIQAYGIESTARLLRIGTGILASGNVSGTARIQCVRCLETYDQPFEGAFDQEYRPLIDVSTGQLLSQEWQAQVDDADGMGEIDEHHELDLREPFRQVAILSLPMKPICRDDCEGIDLGDGSDEHGDWRFGVLGQLLVEESGGSDPRRQR